MTVTEAIVKLRNDIISWCTLNFKKKADVATTNEMKAKLDTLSVHPTHTSYDGSADRCPVNVTVDSMGHVTAVHPVSSVTNINVGDTDGILIASATQEDEQSGGVCYLYAPTLEQHCAQEYIILSSKQYGDTTPPNPVNGQLFFLKVQE